MHPRDIKDYPWAELKPGTGFFVPTLDVAETRAAGIREALKHGHKRLYAYQVIKDGVLGVIFHLRGRHRAPPEPARSEPPESGQALPVSLPDSGPKTPE